MEAKNRIHPRLKDWDYSHNGAYFVTVCVDKRRPILSTIVGRGLAPAIAELNLWGKTVEAELLNIENRFPNIKIDKYVIMPNHVHAILILESEVAGASPRPTVSDAICAWKSLSTRGCRQKGFTGQKLWQTSFYDHITRDENDYLTRWNYIDTNPARWAEDEYYI